jgi:hypothetical protein
MKHSAAMTYIGRRPIMSLSMSRERPDAAAAAADGAEGGSGEQGGGVRDDHRGAAFTR